jgi:hypothetical protein
MPEESRPAPAPTAEELAFVEEFGRLLEEEGAPRIAGRILGWLLICEPPHQSFNDLDEIQELAETVLANEAVPVRARFARYAAEFTAYFERHHDLFLLHLREVPRLLLEDDAHAGRLQARRDRLVEALVPPLEAAMARGARCGRRAGPPRPAEVAEHLTTLLFDGLDAHRAASKAA